MSNKCDSFDLKISYFMKNKSQGVLSDREIFPISCFLVAQIYMYVFLKNI